MSVSCHADPDAGSTYSPSIVRSTDRAAGAPTDRRRSCSFTRWTIAGPAADPERLIWLDRHRDVTRGRAPRPRADRAPAAHRVDGHRRRRDLPLDDGVP